MPPLEIGEYMTDKVLDTMREHNMLAINSVLVALSGGADSVALLHIMHSLSQKHGFKVYAAHVNHGLRGDEAVRDAEFSRQLCSRSGIECFVKDADVRALASEWGISEEMAGRKVRYDFFAELMETHNIDVTATAHHKNDSAETIVMNFMRGSATAGLCGIPYRRDRFIRPLLDVSRCEIEKYCEDNSLDYVTDKTNLDTVYTRNKIRNILIPEIEKEFNPNFCDTVTANAKIIRDDEDFLEKMARNEYDRLVSGNTADAGEIVSLHKAIARRVIRTMTDNVCTTAGISSSVVDAVYKLCKTCRTGTSCDIARGVVARIEYGKLIFDYAQTDCEDFSYDIKLGEKCFIPELGYTVEVCRADERCNDGAKYFMLPDGVGCVTVTNRRQGDRFVPSGMTGSKSVKEYMINEKIPQHMRSRTGILRIGDSIAWIIGYRRDERFKFYKNGIKINIIY
ncbi:MAG: tRNA lysidine(34) synthetase TilS [Clostridia bacterium]|nr:tRNA lysidine(34) synthetase TilS [Clostridia bacterium]